MPPDRLREAANRLCNELVLRKAQFDPLPEPAERAFNDVREALSARPSAVEFPALPAVLAALQELVAVKDLKERTEALHFAGPHGSTGEGWEAEYEVGRAEYLRREPAAWEAARAALAAHAAPSTPAPRADGYSLTYRVEKWTDGKPLEIIGGCKGDITERQVREFHAWLNGAESALATAPAVPVALDVEQVPALGTPESARDIVQTIALALKNGYTPDEILDENSTICERVWAEATTLRAAPQAVPADAQAWSWTDDALQVLRMVDKNNRIAAGERGKAWSGSFVASEVRRVLTRADAATQEPKP